MQVTRNNIIHRMCTLKILTTVQQIIIKQIHEFRVDLKSKLIQKEILSIPLAHI